MQYLVPAVLTFLVGLVLWAITRTRQRLYYDIVESEEFPHGDTVGRYFVVRIRNAGNRHIQNTALSLSFEAGRVDSARCSDPDLASGFHHDDGHVSVQFPLLNPGDDTSVTITAYDKSAVSSPKVTVRGLGVTGKPRPETVFTLADSVATGIMASSLVIGVFYLWQARRANDQVEQLGKSLSAVQDPNGPFESHLRRLENKANELDSRVNGLQESLDQGEPDPQEIMFSILNHAGLGKVALSLPDSPNEVTYWGAGVLILRSFLTDPGKSAKCIEAMEGLVETGNIAPSSLGFDLYVLSKMERFKGRDDKANFYLQRCKKDAPRMYEYLMGQDQYFDLKSLQRSLRSK